MGATELLDEVSMPELDRWNLGALGGTMIIPDAAAVVPATHQCSSGLSQRAAPSAGMRA